MGEGLMDMFDEEELLEKQEGSKVTLTLEKSSKEENNTVQEKKNGIDFRTETYAEKVAVEEQSDSKEERWAEQSKETVPEQRGTAEERNAIKDCMENEDVLKRSGENLRTVFTEMCTSIMKSVEVVDTKVSKLENSVEKVKSGMDEIQGYRDAVSQLKMSLFRNQQNEDRIYKELEIARKDERFALIKPLLESIISIHMELLNSKLQYEQDREVVIRDYGEKAYKEIIGLHDYQMENIEGILQIQGVELIWHTPDTPFNTMEQTVSPKTEATEDSSKKDLIVRAEVPCYRYNDKILRKAKVIMYKVTK